MKETELRPDWYQLGDNDKPMDMNFVDSMNMYLSRVHAALDVLAATDTDQLEGKSVNNVAYMLKGMTFEAKTLLDRWREDQPSKKPVNLEAIK